MNGIGQKVVVVGLQWPEPNATAAGKRLFQLLDFFTDEGCSIHFYATASNTAAKAELDARGIETQQGELNSIHFDVWLKAISPNFVIFDRFIAEEQFGWRVDEVCPSAVKILDLEDFHALRYAREEQLKKGGRIKDILRTSETAKREVAAMFRCDINVVISLVEIEFLREVFNFPKEQLLYLPILVDVNKSSKTLSFQKRKNFVFIGNFLHKPNADAVSYLKSIIWPAIRKRLPKAELFIYGAYITPAFNQMHKPKDGFHVIGFTPNKKKVLSQARILIAPLRFGAGQKGKLLNAMENGLPTVTTPIGAEGLQLGTEEWPGYIAEEDADFVEKSIKLYESEDVWGKSQKFGFVMLNQFSPTQHLPIFKERLCDVQNNLVEVRKKNFIGSMLKHHHQRSTKYLAKWIEEKNRKGYQ